MGSITCTIFCFSSDTHPDRLCEVIPSTLGCIVVPVAHEKIEGPSSTVTFLGIEGDTVALQLQLPGEIVSHAWLGEFMGRKAVW